MSADQQTLPGLVTAEGDGRKEETKGSRKEGGRTKAVAEARKRQKQPEGQVQDPGGEQAGRQEKRLVVGISSRALFDLDESNRIYEEEGIDAYRRHQVEREEDILEPGQGFHLVKKLLRINGLLEEDRVEVILLSRNTADTGLRVANSIESHKLNIKRFAFCGGRSPHDYAGCFGCHLFLSSEPEDVRQALEQGLAAARLLSSSLKDSGGEQLRIAFDGDAVLFSDESERIHESHGLVPFFENEAKNADKPMLDGPFRGFLQGLHDLQKECRKLPEPPIRTALITARSAPAHERVIRTLRAWGIGLDETLFLGGNEKEPFLKAFGADIFFDDRLENCEGAARHMAAGHVLRNSEGERGPRGVSG